MVLMGGSPVRLLRLSGRAAGLLRAWEHGATVGPRRGEQLLARRLVSSGQYVPLPPPGGPSPADVTVVIPVRDRPADLERLLRALEGLRCVVVDDGSDDAATTEGIASRAGAAFVALSPNQGPAAARNAGIAVASTALVAFVDSDCAPGPDWLATLLPHFADPLVAAVAPRIAPAPQAAGGVFARFGAVHSSLDRGPAAGLVRPMSRIPYVPSATLVVRRAVTGRRFFDPRLRGGEDVDVVWRLCEAGWDVRYDPSCVVEHHGPASLSEHLRRRRFYGSTAGPLARRHPMSMAPLHTSAWTAVAWVCVARRRPVGAAAALGASAAVLAHRLRGLTDDPARVAARLVAGGSLRAAVPSLGGLVRAWAPAVVAGLALRRTRRLCALALLVPALRDWAAERPDLDPLRYSALHALDDTAYGSGLWVGCGRARTIRPLVPRVVLHSRVWSAAALRPRRPDEV